MLFRETTNPAIATADGHAMAYRAGANLQDMEMVQFHPTTLYIAGASRALVTEAVRGEGAYLVDHDGYRFMKDYHEAGELAPRDVVSRAIVAQIHKTHYTPVYLDVRHLPSGRFKERFPQLERLLNEFDIDSSKELIPVHPTAHYMIGGVDVDLEGHSSLEGLFAVGEASCTGLHGANRLGSNSLLEGLVFGARAVPAPPGRPGSTTFDFPLKLEHKIAPSLRTELDIGDVKSSLRSLMWRNVGIQRQGQRLEETRDIIGFWTRYVMDKTFQPVGCQPRRRRRRLGGAEHAHRLHADQPTPPIRAPSRAALISASTTPSGMMFTGGSTCCGVRPWKRPCPSRWGEALGQSQKNPGNAYGGFEELENKKVRVMRA